ncbi:C-C motif chemokine 19-like isoform X5 [Anabas testudineus]|uniref:C-C motif chemokine 19-like isoform X5 n=1 Tax=Anabas testudineus TaxID=64144 RepID=UPI000E4540B8|nr:C-C motif chemokine 19-like isoform X5 [Anabas testudineus]
MKMLLVVVLTLICFLCHSSDGLDGVKLTLNSACCNGYRKTPVPKGMITNMVKAPSPCPAIVVTTVCGKMMCVDPTWKFAQAVLRQFERSTAENGSPSAPFNVLKCSKKQ